MTFEDLIIGTHNDFAAVAARRAANNPGKDSPLLIIQSKSGRGKTSLLKAIKSQESKKLSVKYFTANEFIQELIQAMKDQTFTIFKDQCEDADILMIDDFHELKYRSSTQDQLYHIIKLRKESGKQTVLASSKKISKISGLEKWFKSFLISGLTVKIQKIDFEGRLLFAKRFSKLKDLSLHDDVVRFIAASLFQENIRTIEGAVEKLSAVSKTFDGPITVDSAKEHLNFKTFNGDK